MSVETESQTSAGISSTMGVVPNNAGGITFTPTTTVVPSTITTTGTSIPINSPVYTPPTWTWQNSQPITQWPPDPAPNDIKHLMPADNAFIVLYEDVIIGCNGVSKPLARWLDGCHNVKFLQFGEQTVILRSVWDMIWLFVKGEVQYADMNLTEFLDKTFSPKSSPASQDSAPATNDTLNTIK